MQHSVLSSSIDHIKNKPLPCASLVNSITRAGGEGENTATRFEKWSESLARTVCFHLSEAELQVGSMSVDALDVLRYPRRAAQQPAHVQLDSTRHVHHLLIGADADIDTTANIDINGWGGDTTVGRKDNACHCRRPHDPTSQQCREGDMCRVSTGQAPFHENILYHTSFYF